MNQCMLLSVAASTGILGALTCAAEPVVSDRLSPVPFTQVRINDAFWAPRIETNRAVTIPYDFDMCEKTGRIRNFRVAGGLEDGSFEGIYFNDSDVYKVVEGASYSLQAHPDADLDAYLDGLIASIAAAQEDDGYLYTIRTIQGETITQRGSGPERWSYLAHSHELYNVGHLYEAAAAHYRATGKRSLLDVAVRSADLICATFGPNPGQRVDVPGHQEIEIGLVKLFDVTGDRRYLDQAAFFLDMRGRRDLREVFGEYCQDQAPVVEQTEPVGHAVRAGYMYAAMADVAARLERPEYITSLERIWDRLVSAQTYLTGGVGAHRHNEGFGEAYDLPNDTAYNETCAAIANMLWNHRMFLLRGEATFMDVFERSLYNAFLPGVGLSGDTFFYPNPLAWDGQSTFNQGCAGRSPWFSCSCCPVNIVRVLPSLSQYVYATRGDEVFVSLFMGCDADLSVAGSPVRIEQRTRYPYDGDVAITLRPERPTTMTLSLRVPAWARGHVLPTSTLYRYVDAKPVGMEVRVNGEPVEAAPNDGWIHVRRSWRAGDEVRVHLDMPVRRVVADERVAANHGLVALERGPLVYCFEGQDNCGGVSTICLPDDATFDVRPRTRGLDAPTLVADGSGRVVWDEHGLVRVEPYAAVAVPYCLWANRELYPMSVWVARTPEGVRLPPPPTVASQARASASHCYGGDSVSAINDLHEPKNSGDHDLPRLTWWDHRGTEEWAALEFERPTRVSELDVYWFDDTGRGLCRVPESWTLECRAGGQWSPVKTTDAFGTEPDRFHTVQFAPVEAEALRVNVHLQEGFSGGILEVRVR